MKITEYLASAKNFEESKSAFNESRVSTYKLIAVLGAVFGILSMIALIVALPFKTTEPYVIRVNEVTGDAEIITRLNEQIQTVDEAVDKFNVARYVRAREGYVFDLVRHDYDMVITQTTPEIVGDYTSRYEGKTGRAEVLKDQVIIKPVIRSITLGTSNGAPMATIRFVLNRKDIRSGTENRRSLIVTLSYSYNSTAPMTEAQRLENPFGFMVNAYRVDVENE